MKRTSIIFAIVISIGSFSIEGSSQYRRTIANRPNSGVRVAAGDVNNDNFRSRRRRNSLVVNGQGGNDQISMRNGRTNSITFEGNDEPLWANRPRRVHANSVGTAQNVGPDIHGRRRANGIYIDDIIIGARPRGVRSSARN